MRINNNLMAMNTHRQLGLGNAAAAKSMEKLSSGYRINRAGDDAAGLAISEKMRGQIRGLTQASRNAQDGISLIQTAEGALNETHAILQRMRELAVQAANDTNIEVDRSEIQKEMNELIDEIDRIATSTQFNQQDLLTGRFEGKFHIGANEGQNITLKISNMKAGFAPSVEVNGDVTFDPAFDGASVSAVSGFTASESVTLAITHSSGQSAATANQTLTITDVPGDNSTLVINGYTIGFKNSDNGTDVDGADTVIDTKGKTVTEIRDAILALDGNIADIELEASDTDKLIVKAASAGAAGNDIETSVAGTSSITGVGNLTGGADEIEAGYSATINGEAVTQVITSDSGVKTYSTASGKSITADLGTFTFNDSTKYITFNITVVDVAEDDKGLQVGQLKVDNVTKDSVGGVMTQAGADKAITTIQTAIETVSAERSKLGAYQNRLEHTIKNLDNGAENLQAAESRIRDVDIAKEMMEFTKNNILQQAATAMLAQANQAPQAVLQLLR